MRYHDTAEIRAMDAAPLFPARSRCMTQELWCHNAMQARERAMIITGTNGTVEVKTERGWVKVVEPITIEAHVHLEYLLSACNSARKATWFLRIPAVQRYRLNARPAYQRKRRAR